MNLNKIRALLCLALTAFVSTTYATTYYVDGDFGNDANNGKFVYDVNNTFPNGPKATIAAAMSLITDGDLIEITGGNYPDCLKVTKSVSFSLQDHISIKCLIMDGVGKRAIIIGGRDLTVIDSIKLVNGIIDASGSNNNLVAGFKCKVLGGSRTSFVDNKLHRVNSQTVVTDLFYPIGTGQDYRPVYINFSQNNGSQNRYWIQAYSVGPPAGSLPPGIKNVSKIHYWNLRYGNASVPSKFIYQPFYDSTKNDDEVFDAPGLRVVAYQGSIGAYVNQGGKGSANFRGNIKSTNSSDTTGIFTLANVVGATNTLGRRDPVAKFGWIGKCINAPIQFRDSSYSHKSKLIKWSWDFGVPGNADTSFLAMPKFTYTSVGPWTVRLIVTNDLGKSDTIFRTITLKNGPDAFFAKGNDCFGKTMVFSDGSSVDAPDTIKSWFWRLGDGSTRILKSFNYVYSNPGKYTTQLIVSSSSGCVDTFTKDINIFNKPSPNFSIGNTCRLDSTKFSGGGGTSGDTISKWQWIVNSVPEGTTQKYTKVFTTFGSQNVSLAVESQSGCLDTISKPLIIYELPKASFFLDPSINPNDSVQCYRGNKFSFFNASSAIQGQILTASFFWGSSFTTGGAIGSRKTSGTFPVKLNIVTNRGCKDSVVLNYRVLDSIAVKFSEATYCLPKPAEFIDSSKTISGTITNRVWKYGDGNKGSGVNTTHAYATGGTYKLELVITNSEGCSDSLSRNILLSNTPAHTLVLGSNNPLCPGDSFRVIANGGNYVRWNNLDTSRLRYLKTAGKYKVTYYNSPFCFESDSVTISMLPPVFPDAGNDTSLVRGRYIVLKGEGGVKYSWLPRNETETPDSVRTRVKPQSTMTYYLLVTDGNGCVGIDSVKVTVTEPLFIRIPNMITPNGDNKNDQWDLREVPNIETGRVTIYNSLGEMVWQLDNGYNHTWVGTDSTGYPLPMGDYLYVIEVPTEKEPFRGFLHIAY